MPRTSRWIVGTVFGLLLLAPFSPSQTPQPRKAPKTLHKKTHHKPVPPPPMVLPPMPSGALPQVPMDQLPPVRPQISYQNGLLTIVAQNSTLADVLREVHNRTGASIDVPPNATERVVTRLGPGPARDILASLLNGSTFNYVMLGSASDPAAVTTVILTTKTAGGTGTAVANAYQPNPAIPPERVPVIQPAVVPAGNPQAANSDEDNSDDEDAEENADQEPTQGGNGQPDANAGNPQGSPEPNAGPKTPEQMLEMLRQRQQPGQPPPVPPPVNQQPPE